MRAPRVPLDLSTIRCVSSNGQFLVLQPRLLQPESEDLKTPSASAVKAAKARTQPPTVLLTDTLTHTVVKEASYQLAGPSGKVYDWSRGPSAEGSVHSLSSPLPFFFSVISSLLAHFFFSNSDLT